MILHFSDCETGLKSRAGRGDLGRVGLGVMWDF